MSRAIIKIIKNTVSANNIIKPMPINISIKPINAKNENRQPNNRAVAKIIRIDFSFGVKMLLLNRLPKLISSSPISCWIIGIVYHFIPIRETTGPRFKLNGNSQKKRRKKVITLLHRSIPIGCPY
jgi:hypothetical protein